MEAVGIVKKGVIMQTEKKKLSELHKTDKNIRRHSDRQIDEYIRSLKMFGQIRPLVVTEDGEILVGNGMFDALSKMGETDCDVYVVAGMSQAQKRKLMLADNKVYELGFTDMVLLDDILGDLGGDFDIPGYDSSLLDVIVKNPLEADNDLLKYEDDVANTTVEKNEVVTTASEAGSEPQYAPPVRTESGTFTSPAEAIDAGEFSEEEERKFMICPHCGEKIWL